MERIPTRTELHFLNSFFNCDFFPQSGDEDNIKLATALYVIAKRKFFSVCQTESRSEELVSLGYKLRNATGNLRRTMRTFNDASRATPEFLRSCPTWAATRKNTISELRKLAREINSDRRNCNTAKAGSCSVGILGGFIGISAFIFPPAAVVLGVVGLVTAAVGGAATFGTSLTEMSLLNRSVKKAKVVLKNDEDSFINMTPWFKHAQDIITLIEDVIGFDVAKDMYEKLTDSEKEINIFTNIQNGEINPKLRDMVETCVEKVTRNRFTYRDPLVPSIVTFFFVAILLHRKNNLMLGCVVRSHRLVLGLIKILDLGSDLGMTIASATLKTGVVVTKEVSQATARMIAQSALFGFGIVLDVANLVITSIDIHKGSKSTKANDINIIADRMENELNELESIYKQLGGVSF